ncbi:MAG: DegT/DnrJ/EryC1/StrS family aminotransferase [Microgenomates group bacterium]
MNTIPLYAPQSNYSSKVYNSGCWIDGSYTKELEERLKEYLHVPYVILTSSGTAALLAAYWVLKNKKLPLVVDPYTFPATYQPARMLDYEIIFQRMIMPKQVNPVVLIPEKRMYTVTHLFGQPNVLIEPYAKQLCIEDACQAFGAKYNGQCVGTIGSIGCYSFYPTKTLHTCGHAGAVVTKDERYYRSMKTFIESGRENGKMTNTIALNLRIDELKAEYILKELSQYDKRISLQREIAEEYKQCIPEKQPLVEEIPGNFNIYSVFNLLIKKRDAFRKHMEKFGIQTMVYYNEDMLPVRQRNAYKDITSSIVSIPCRYSLTTKEVKKITFALKAWYV